MGFLDYSNQTHSNIIPKEEFENLVHEVFGVIATNISRSLGPLGSSATILDGMMTEATKDGYAILSKYRFHNRYKKMIYNLIKAPCTRMNNTVGDGTTTAIALTNALFNRYESQKNVLNTMYRLPRQFVQAWDEVIADLTERIKSKALTIDPEDFDTIFNLAYVTSNGNNDISTNIAKIYKDARTPGIKEKDSPTNKSYITAIKGFDFPANLISDAFVRNQDLTATEKDIAVMIFDHKLETDVFNQLIIPINEVLRAQGNKLLILAPYYDEYMCNTFVDQHVNMEFRKYGKLNLILAQFELGKLSPHQMTDLAVVLRAKVVTQDIESSIIETINNDGNDAFVDAIFADPEHMFYHTIGIATEASLSCTSGAIFNVDGIEEDEHYQETLRRAKQDLDDIKGKIDYEKQSYAHKIYEANARILQLQMKNYIYYIGADSALQKQITWDAVEDVIKCVRSAIKYGVVPGCQLSLITACTEAINEIAKISDISLLNESNVTENLSDYDKLKIKIISIIHAALIDVYAQVLHGPDGVGMIKLMPRWQYTTEDGLETLQKEAINKGNSIIEESIKKNQVFDLESLEYNPKIITSAETDMMVLSAASELVKILISGNQCIFLDSDVDESHQEEVAVYT